jgi:hypothetical protein
MNEKSNGGGQRANLATMDYAQLALTLRQRAKAMMAAKNFNGAVVFGTLATRFQDCARDVDTLRLNEVAIASMIMEGGHVACTEWAKEKLAAAEKAAQE